MANYFRTYFDKSNTIIKNSFVNTSQNPVTELWYGSDFLGGSTGGTVSRYIFSFDVNKLRQLYINNDIPTGSTNVKHTLKMTSTGFFSTSKNVLGPNGRLRASQFELQLYRLTNGEWNEGSGYSFPGTIRNQQFDNETFPSNWFERQVGVNWTTPGAIAYDLYASSTLLISSVSSVTVSDTNRFVTSQYFKTGDENLEMDITDLVESYIRETVNNDGLILLYPESIEASASSLNRIFTKPFFSNPTVSFYEPYVETTWDTIIEDDRDLFFLDKTNKLYYYFYAGGILSDLDFKPSAVTITDWQGDIIDTLTGNSIIHRAKGIYEIQYSIPSLSGYPTDVIFSDTWKGIVFKGRKLDDKELDFKLIDESYYYKTQGILEPSRFSIDVRGIRNAEKLISGDKRFISVYTNELYSFRNKQILPSEIEYRIYVKEGRDQLNVIPYTKLNRGDCFFFFILDTSWLLPTEYFIEFRINQYGSQSVANDVYRFQIVNNLNFQF